MTSATGSQVVVPTRIVSGECWSRGSFIAADAINEYLDINEWQVTGIKRAIASLDRGEGA